MTRIRSLDLARGFTVLLIAPIHSMLVYSQPAVRTTLIGQLFRVIAEGPGAPLFMTIMGITFALKKEQPFSRVLGKSALLLAAGYSLNVVKFVVPYRLGWLPSGLLTDLQVPAHGGAMTLFGLGDILQFAAPALLLLYMLTRFEHYACMAMTLAISITWLSPLVWDAHSKSGIVNYILQLATSQPPRTFFPLFPWLVYPLVGLAIGHTIRRDGKMNADTIGTWGLGLIVLAGAFRLLYPRVPETTFYRTYPMDTAGHLGIVLVTLYGWDVLYRYVKPNALFRLFTYCSRNITQIYLIQWPLLFAALPLIGFQALDYRASLFAVVISTAVTLFLALALSNGRAGGIRIED